MSTQIQQVIQQTKMAEKVTTSDSGFSHALTVWETFKTWLGDSNNLLIVFLLIIGVVLRNSKKVSNWTIAWLIPLVGFVLGGFYIGFLKHETDFWSGAMIGAVYGFVTVAVHNIIIHTAESPSGAALMKVPILGLFIASIAEMLGADTSKAYDIPLTSIGAQTRKDSQVRTVNKGTGDGSTRVPPVPPVSPTPPVPPVAPA